MWAQKRKSSLYLKGKIDILKCGHKKEDHLYILLA